MSSPRFKKYDSVKRGESLYTITAGPYFFENFFIYDVVDKSGHELIGVAENELEDIYESQEEIRFSY